MSKIHIDRMAGAVKRYYSEAVIAQQKIKRNNEIYMKEFAEPENEKIVAQLRTARKAAEDAITAAQESGRAEALAWGKLDGSKLTKDADLLKFDISPEQYDDLVERYKGNGTMSTLLHDYGEKMNAKFREEKGQSGQMPEAVYHSRNIPTAEKKAEVYDKFANGAYNILNRIDSPGTFGGGTDSQMLKLAVETFGQPDGTSAHLFDML